MKTFDVITAILLIIGGLNWGLVGFFQYDLISTIFGGMAMVVTRFIYGLVGVGAIYSIIRLLNWSTVKSSYCSNLTHATR